MVGGGVTGRLGGEGAAVNRAKVSKNESGQQEVGHFATYLTPPTAFMPQASNLARLLLRH